MATIYLIESTNRTNAGRKLANVIEKMNAAKGDGLEIAGLMSEAIGTGASTVESIFTIETGGGSAVNTRFQNGLKILDETVDVSSETVENLRTWIGHLRELMNATVPE